MRLRNPAMGRNDRAQGEAVDVVDLRSASGLPGDDFIAGRKNRDARSRVHVEVAGSRRRRARRHGSDSARLPAHHEIAG